MILDEYVFLKRLGEGAFATVWAARKRVGDDRRKLYAVKHLKQSDDPSSGKNLLTTPEFRSLKAIPRCPHVLRAVQVARERGEVFLVTEWCDTDLLKLIERARERGLRALPEPVVASAVRHLLVALEHCHKSGWTHRDVKPENVLIADGVAKLADFGEATEFGSPDARVTYCGTRWYRAPEQFVRDGTAPPSERPGAADVWAAGCVMAECFLGHALFRGASSADMLDTIAETLGRGGDENLPEAYERAWTTRSGRGDAPRGPGRLDALLAGTGASPDARSLLRHMLRVDPSRRVSAAKALRHPFLARADPRDRVELPEDRGLHGTPRTGRFARRDASRGEALDGGGDVALGAKAAARAEALRRRREAAADSSDDEFDFDAPSRIREAEGARGTREEGFSAAAIADAAPAAVDGRSDEGDIPDEPTAEAEAAMGEIRRRMEAAGARGGAGPGRVPGVPGTLPPPTPSPSIGASASASVTASARAEGVTASVRAMNIGGMGERAPAASSGTAAEADSSGDDADGIAPRGGASRAAAARGGAVGARAMGVGRAGRRVLGGGGSGMTSYASAGYSDDEFEAE